MGEANTSEANGITDEDQPASVPEAAGGPADPRGVVLTGEQQAALDHLLGFGKPVQTLGGLAGTGKSVLVQRLKRALPGFFVCASTGKAAAALRRRGVRGASTIHSLIYVPVEEETVDEKGKLVTRVRWELKTKEELIGAGDGHIDGFIVDEASMVGDAIYRDLLSFGLPIIFVGDHGQLGPAGDSDINLMKAPDVVLETVHRNAGEIERFAHFLRSGGEAADWGKHEDCTEDRVTLVKKSGMGEFDWRSFDQIICAYNQTRVGLNMAIREELRRPENSPACGDRVMCLKNNRSMGLYNGMQGTIVAVSPKKGSMTFRSGGRGYRVLYEPEAFNRVRRLEHETRRGDGRLPFDYAYCVTAHKFQGDECPRVMVIEQRCRLWEHTRWAYTAASRAKEQLVWVEG